MHLLPKSQSHGPLYLSFPSLGTTGAVVLLSLLTVFHIWLAAFLPPADDELYYWSWAQTLQSSYFDHPPMVAYLIRASTSIFGNSVLALRLPAIAISLFIFIALLRLAPRGNLIWALLFCPLTFIGSVLITPDLPLVFFWTLYALWFAWINASLEGWSSDPITRVYQNSPVTWLQWIIGGTLLGLGGLSKYTMLLAVPSGLAALAIRTRLRAWGPGYLFHLFIAGLLVSPVLVFNWRYGFAPLHFQWNHSMGSSGISFSEWFRFIGGQILLVGALPFLLFIWIAVRYRDLCADAKSQAYFAFFMLPFGFFVYKALSHKLEANWPIVGYLTFWPIADRLLSWSSFRGIVRGVVGISFLAPWAVSAIILIHLIRPFPSFEPRFDRVAVLRGQWETAQQIAAEIHAQGISTVWLPNYQWTSYMRFLGVGGEQTVPSGRESQFTLGAKQTCEVAGEQAVSLDTSDAHSGALSCFSKREVLKQFVVTARGQEVGRVWLARYSR